MKKTIAFIGILMLFGCGEEQKVEVGQKTTMEITPEFNAGTVIKGEIIKARFKVENTGDYPLVFGEVRGSCSCTVAEKPEEPLQPGETAEILAEVNTENLTSKKISKSVTILANTEPSLTVVTIKGTLKK
ncbi:MAG: DUF1573 domain-containing protein [Bacteroidetes bacterium]|nr:DUF1573 domain-containing protein [Bacteroidota bacterium]